MSIIEAPKPTYDPFLDRIKRLRAQEEREAAEAERQRLIDAAAADERMREAEAERQKQLKVQAAAAELAEQQRRITVRHEHLKRQVPIFVEKFLYALTDMSDKYNWTADESEAAWAYAHQLIRKNDDITIEDIQPNLMKAVRGKFAFGLAIRRTELRNIHEENYFLGMNQEWFAGLYESSLEAVKNMKSRQA